MGTREMGTGRGSRGGRLRRAAWLVLVPIAPVLFSAPGAQAQSVVEVLRQQRREARAAEVVAERGPRVAALPIVEVGEADRWTRAFRAAEAARQAERDRLLRAEEAKADSLIRAAQLATLRWRKVEPGAQQSFVEQFGETYWVAAQPGPRLLVDTSRTDLLRGRLQAAFGDPTRNGDAQQRHGYGGSEFVQFEYWFVVNDSIPLLALDVDGPFGHGLLVASDERYAGLLEPVKAELSARLDAARRPDPWLDYYHSFERRAWFRTGFNGAEHFTVEVRPPRWSARAPTDRWIIHR